MKKKLINEFAEWLKKYSAVELMRNYDFAEYKINLLLEGEAPGEIIDEDESTFSAMYEYTFAISTEHSIDGKAHSFCFDVKVIGIKGNVTANDYEIEDCTELEYIIR